MDDSQLMKGIMEGCILGIILKGETYGYEIISVLNHYGFKDIQDGTLYPILNRLEKKGLVSCRIANSPLGPKRKYFSVTTSGQEYFAVFVDSLNTIMAKALLIIGDTGEKKHE